MKLLLSSFLMLCIASLMACNTIEHRSDKVKKDPLPAIEKETPPAKKRWTNTSSNGVGKTEGKLRLGFSNDLIVTADHKGQILAVHATTGKEAWRQNTKLSITAGPSVSKGMLYVGTREGEVHAYRVQDGSWVWKSTVTGEVLAPPEADYGVVYVNALDGSVTALHAEDGQQLWRYSLQVPALVLRRSSSPVVKGNQVITGFANGKIVALHRMDGSVDWEREIAEPKGRYDIQRMVDVSVDPQLLDGTVYAVGYQGKLSALSAETGTPIWQREMSSHSGFVIQHDTLFISDVKGTLWALNRKNGNVLWKQAGLSGRRLTAPEIFHDYVVVGDDDGYLHWISKMDGHFVGRQQVDGKGIEAQPRVVNNQLFVLGRSGTIVSFAGE